MLIRANYYDAVLHPGTPWSRVQSSCEGSAFASALCGFLPQSAEGFFIWVGTMRRLVHIPIIHTAADLGSLSELVRTHYAKVLGTAELEPTRANRSIALDRHPDESRRPSSGLSEGAHLPGWAAHLRLRGADRPRIGQRGQQQPPVDPPPAGRGRHLDGHGGSRAADGRIRDAETASRPPGGSCFRPASTSPKGTSRSRAPSPRCVRCQADCRYAPRGRSGAALPRRLAPVGFAPVHRSPNWKRWATAHAKLYGGHGPSTTQRPSRQRGRIPPFGSERRPHARLDQERQPDHKGRRGRQLSPLAVCALQSPEKLLDDLPLQFRGGIRPPIVRATLLQVGRPLRVMECVRTCRRVYSDGVIRNPISQAPSSFSRRSSSSRRRACSRAWISASSRSSTPNRTGNTHVRRWIASRATHGDGA